MSTSLPGSPGGFLENFLFILKSFNKVSSSRSLKNSTISSKSRIPISSFWAWTYGHVCFLNSATSCSSCLIRGSNTFVIATRASISTTHIYSLNCPCSNGVFYTTVFYRCTPMNICPTRWKHQQFTLNWSNFFTANKLRTPPLIFF